jgi:hypothetical protein
MRRLIVDLLILGAVLLLLLQSAAAQTTQQQFWPETDFYLQMKPKLRGDIVFARSQDPGNNDSFEFGPDIEFYIKRFVKDLILTNNTANRQFLAFRAGYHYLSGVGQPSENRGIIQGNARVPVGWSMVLSDRNRLDLRWVQNQPFSWRYRNRLMLERSFRIRRMRITPYVDGEIIWSSTTQSWNQNLFDVGVTVPIRNWLEFTPYYERNNQTGSPSAHSNVFGFTTAFYFSRPGASD